MLILGLSVPLLAVAPAEAAVASDPGIVSSTQLAVIGITLVMFGSAYLAARTARRNPLRGVLPIRSDLIEVDLLDIPKASDQDPRIVSTLEKALLFVLVGYAILDRGFAWFHVPGTPLFLGEIVLALAALAMMSTRAPMLAAFKLSPALKVLAVWMAWGAVFLILQMPTYGLDAIRDSAIWYYGSVAAIALFLMLSDPSRFGTWAALYLKFIPFLLLWFPIAVAGDTILGAGAPYVPDSSVPLFTHRFGNIAVHSAMALGFIWLVDRNWGRLSSTQRITYSSMAVLGIGLAGFQNRGGFISASIGIIVMLMFMRQRKAELVLAVGTVAVILATAAVITDVSIPISNKREISAAQFIDNLGSVVDPDSAESRQQKTTQWRLELWTAVLDDVVTQHPISGFGPGPDLGERYGVEGGGEVKLRNPHNSHLGVMARMGLVGFAIWALLWITWAFQLLLLRSHLMRRGRIVEGNLAAWIVVSALMMLVNSVFDPTLEGPQVAFWLWTIFGIGVAMPIAYTGLAGDLGSKVGAWIGADAGPSGHASTR